MSRLLRIEAACAYTGDRRSSFYDKVKRGIYPRPVPTGPRTRAWLESELEAVVERMVAQRDAEIVS